MSPSATPAKPSRKSTQVPRPRSAPVAPSTGFATPRRKTGLLIAIVAVVAIGLGVWLVASGSHSTPADPGAGGSSALAAQQRALGALSAAMNAKDKACGSMTGPAFTTCISQFAVLTKQYNDLVACFGNATTVDKVSACEDRLGVEH